MNKDKKPKFEKSLIFLILVSFLGLTFSFIFLATSAGAQDGFEFRKPFVGSVFVALCVLGIFASIYPSSCSKILDYEKRIEPHNEIGKQEGINLQGHHPTCENYSAHILKVGNKIFCATCTGFAVGALIAIIGVGLFFFGSMDFGPNPFIIMIIGSLFVSTGLLHSILPGFNIGFSRFIASSLFAIGSFLILASIEDSVANTSIDLFYILLSVFWLLTDTALSRWDHRRICSTCSSQACRRK